MERTILVHVTFVGAGACWHGPYARRNIYGIKFMGSAVDSIGFDFVAADIARLVQKRHRALFLAPLAELGRVVTGGEKSVGYVNVSFCI